MKEFEEFCCGCGIVATFESILLTVGENYKYNLYACKNCGNVIAKPNKSDDDA